MPETTTGRTAAVMIMLTGVSVLGLLAGTLASFFRLQPDGSAATSATPEPAPPAAAAAHPAQSTPAATTAPPGLDQVLSELLDGPDRAALTRCLRIVVGSRGRVFLAETNFRGSQLGYLKASGGEPAEHPAAVDAGDRRPAAARSFRAPERAQSFPPRHGR